jgi:hypothetical protein
MEIPLELKGREPYSIILTSFESNPSNKISSSCSASKIVIIVRSARDQVLHLGLVWVPKKIFHRRVFIHSKIVKFNPLKN